MKIRVIGKSDILERARDCFKIGHEIAELRCSLQGAVHELSERDISWAKTYLYDAEAHAKELTLIYPDVTAGAILRGIRKVTNQIDKVGMSRIGGPKAGTIEKKIAVLREASQNIRARAKVHCNVPLPFQEKRKIRRSL